MTFESLLNAVLAPVRAFASPNQRVYGPFLLGALVLALLVAAFSRDRAGLRALVSPKVWLHPSSRLDLGLFAVKPLLRALLVTPWMWSAFSLATWLVGVLDGLWGVPTESGLHPVTIRLLYTGTLFVAWDLSRYLVHRAAHAVPFLWELHKVHHSAEVMTPMTIYRSHPLESLLFQVRGVVVSGLVTGVFFHLFRNEALQYDFLGVNAAGFALNLLGGNLRHSHVWLRYPRWLERVLISPAQHQVHHSSVLEQCHSNYGSWLAIWDGLAGSLRSSHDTPRPLRFGLPEAQLNHSPRGLRSALVGPLVAWGRRFGRGAWGVLPR